jgi:hypothetical protein
VRRGQLVKNLLCGAGVQSDRLPTQLLESTPPNGQKKLPEPPVGKPYVLTIESLQDLNSTRKNGMTPSPPILQAVSVDTLHFLQALIRGHFSPSLGTAGYGLLPKHPCPTATATKGRCQI